MNTIAFESVRKKASLSAINTNSAPETSTWSRVRTLRIEPLSRSHKLADSTVYLCEKYSCWPEFAEPFRRHQIRDEPDEAPNGLIGRNHDRCAKFSLAAADRYIQICCLSVVALEHKLTRALAAARAPRMQANQLGRSELVPVGDRRLLMS